MKHLLILLLFPALLFAQKPTCFVYTDINQDGLGCSKFMRIQNTETGTSMKVYNDELTNIKNFTSATDYRIKRIDGTYSTIIIYDKDFDIYSDIEFHPSNIKVGKDSIITITNKNTIGGEKKGTTYTDLFGLVFYVFEFPENFKIIDYQVEPEGFDKIKQGNKVFMGGKDNSRIEYTLTYQRTITNQLMLNNGREDKPLSTIKMKKQNLKLELWDGGIEDDDIVNIYVNGKLVWDHFNPKKIKETFDLPIGTSKKDKFIMTVECVSEGKIRPNTFKMRFYSLDKDVDNTIDVSASMKHNGLIVLEILP